MAVTAPSLRAGIAFRGAKATTNFPAENYDKDELLLRYQMGLVSKDELVKLLRGCSLTGKRAPRAETRGVPAPADPAYQAIRQAVEEAQRGSAAGPGGGGGGMHPVPEIRGPLPGLFRDRDV